MLGVGTALVCLIPLVALRPQRVVSLTFFPGFLYGLLQILIGIIHGATREARSALATPSDFWRFSAPQAGLIPNRVRGRVARVPAGRPPEPRDGHPGCWASCSERDSRGSSGRW